MSWDYEYAPDVAPLPKSNDPVSVADRYRFSGYQLPKVRLADGFLYDDVAPHPSFTQGEETWWHQRAVSYATPVGDNIDPTDYPSTDAAPIL